MTTNRTKRVLIIACGLLAGCAFGLALDTWSGGRASTQFARIVSLAGDIGNPEPGGDEAPNGGAPEPAVDPAPVIQDPRGPLWDNKVRQVLQDCARTAAEKGVGDAAAGKKFDLPGLTDSAAQCVQSALTQTGKYNHETIALVISAQRSYFKCLGDTAGVRDAWNSSASATKPAGRAFAGLVLAALEAVGSTDCAELFKNLHIVGSNNSILALGHHGARCVVVTIKGVTKTVSDVNALTEMKRDELVKIGVSMIVGDSKPAKDKLDELEKAVKSRVDDFFAACDAARKAAGVVGGEIKDSATFIGRGGEVITPEGSIFTFPLFKTAYDYFFQWKLKGIIPYPRFSEHPVQLVDGRLLSDLKANVSPETPDRVTFQTSTGSIVVTRADSRFSADGVTGYVVFGNGPLRLVINLPDGGYQSMALDVNGKIEHQVAADGSIQYASTVIRDNQVWHVTTHLSGATISQTARNASGSIAIHGENGRVVEVRYADGTSEKPYYDENGKLVGSRLTFKDGTVVFQQPSPDGKLTVDTAVLPNGQVVRMRATYDQNGVRTGGVIRGDAGYLTYVDNDNRIIAEYRTTTFMSGAASAGELRCARDRSCYTVDKDGRPLLYVAADGRVYRVDGWIDKDGKRHDPKELPPDTVIRDVVPYVPSAFSAEFRTIDLPTAASVEAHMRAMYGLNIYTGGGELGGPQLLVGCTACQITQYVTISCFGQSVPIAGANGTCQALAQQRTQEMLRKLANTEPLGVDDVPTTMEAGKRYRVKVAYRNSSGVDVPEWRSPEFQIVAFEASGAAWGVSNVELPSGRTVATGGVAEFVFDVVAPVIPGTYPFHWAMTRSGQRIGRVASTTTVTVVAPQEPAVTPVDAVTYIAPLKRGGYATLFGPRLAAKAESGSIDPEACAIELGGRNVYMLKSDGTTIATPCVTYVSPTQINIWIPQVPAGNYKVVVHDVEGEAVAASSDVWVGD